MMCFLMLTLFLIEIVVVHGFDWCTLTCNGQPHTMCKYTTDKCQGTLSESDKKLILDLHNRFRSNIATANNTGQPEASNMRLLTWNDEAAEIAGKWAHQCSFEQDTCRILQNKENLGQSLAMKGSADKKTAADIIDEWLNNWYVERTHLIPKDIEKFEPDNFMKVGHYTQMVWAETHQIGCGFGSIVEGPYTKGFLVCNYYPSGNIARVPMYLKGTHCSKCPDGTSCSKEYPGLCASLGSHTLSALAPLITCFLILILY